MNDATVDPRATTMQVVDPPYRANSLPDTGIDPLAPSTTSRYWDGAASSDTTANLARVDRTHERHAK